jgi:quercetin dioxygenase-like cupin family protein
MNPTTASTTTVSPEPYEVRSGDGEPVWIAGDTLTFKATAETTGGGLTLIACDAAPGGGPPPHIHDNEDEAFYVVDGTFEILLGDRLVRAHAGDFAFVPRGTVHRFANVGDAPGRILILFTPGGLEGFFRAAGIPAGGDGSPPPVDAAEIERTDGVAADYGLRIVEWPASLTRDR